MKTRSIKSAVYAAGVVFAPSEDFPSSDTVPRAKVRAKRRRNETATAPYQAQFVAAKTPSAKTSDSWWRSLDVTWIFGRAPA